MDSPKHPTDYTTAPNGSLADMQARARMRGQVYHEGQRHVLNFMRSFSRYFLEGFHEACGAGHE